MSFLSFWLILLLAPGAPENREHWAVSNHICMKYLNKYNTNFHFRTDNSAALIADSNADDNYLKKIDSKDHSLSAKSIASQKPWQKCAALKESPSDITTQEEYYKFDFQVRPCNHATIHIPWNKLMWHFSVRSFFEIYNF